MVKCEHITMFVHTNGVKECFKCGTLFVPKDLLHLYNFPQYAGKIEVLDSEEKNKQIGGGG